MKAQPRRSFSAKLLRGLTTASKLAGAAHTAYQIGKGLYHVATAIGPLAAPFVL